MEKILNKVNWSPPEDWQCIETVDMHTGGEPLRIFVAGLPDIKGNSILEKRRYFRENLDHIRTGTMWEPRGHADMYGAIITDPVSEDADFGTFFLHNEGYSTMCGHAIIALTKFAIETGMVIKSEENPQLIIDAPPGKIRSKAFMKDGTVEKVSFINVPSFLLLKDKNVRIPGPGNINFDVAYGGAFYAFCNANDLNLELNTSNAAQFIDYGKRIKEAVKNTYKIEHPFEEDLSFLYGTIFIGEAHNKKNHSRNVCIFADGELDRSPTGSGVSARAGLHYSKDELKVNEKITIESILNTKMDVKIKEVTQYGPYEAVIPEVTGTAFFSGQNKFYFDPNDSLKNGFLIR